MFHKFMVENEMISCILNAASIIDGLTGCMTDMNPIHYAIAQREHCSPIQAESYEGTRTWTKFQ